MNQPVSCQTAFLLRYEHPLCFSSVCIRPHCYPDIRVEIDRKRSPLKSLYMAAEQDASAVARHSADQITVDEVSGIHGGCGGFANDHSVKLLKSTMSELLSKQTPSRRHSNHLKPGYYQLEFVRPRSRLRERPPVPFAKRGDIYPAQR